MPSSPHHSPPTRARSSRRCRACRREPDDDRQAEPDTLPARPRFNWRDFFRRAGWLESIGIVGVPVVTLVAVLAPWITPFDPQLRVAGAYLPPSAAHWFGTDEIGRDLFSRVILGVQYTWLPALAVIGFSLAVGSLVGLISGLMGGKVDLVIERIVDLFLVLPSTLIALAVVAALGPGLVNTMIAIAIFWWPWYARISRDEIRRLKARPHVEAARIAGVRGPRLLLRYLLPGVVPALARRGDARCRQHHHDDVADVVPRPWTSRHRRLNSAR